MDVSTLRKISYSDFGINSRRISTKWSSNPVRAFDICSEMRSDSKQCFAFVVDEFFWLWHTKDLDWWERLFKKLDTRQSKILLISAKMIIETFQEYFSISSFGWRKHQASFYNVLVWQTNLCLQRYKQQLMEQPCVRNTYGLRDSQ